MAIATEEIMTITLPVTQPDTMSMAVTHISRIGMWTDGLDLQEAAFRAWLAARGLSTIVGHNLDPNDCPLANWIKFLTGCAVVRVTQSYIWCFSGHDWREPVLGAMTPPWAARFIVRVDDNLHQLIPTPVTAGKALSLLD